MNRELSWLSFNERVLQEAEDVTVPLMERLKFMGIFSSNLDEFYSVRVGTLKRLIDSKEKTDAFLGGTPKKVFSKVIDRTKFLRDEFDRTLVNLLEEMRDEGIIMVNEKEVDEQQREFLDRYFAEKVRPRLVPIMLENVEGFPYLHNLFIYLAVVLQKRSDPSDHKYALIEVPADVLPRFVRLPGNDDETHIIMLDDIIRYGLKDIFSTFDYEDISAYTIKVTRDSELDIETDVTTSFFEQMSRSLKNREQGDPVRFVYDREIPEDLLECIVKKNKLPEEILISGSRYHNARDMVSFPNPGAKYGRLRFENPEPLDHPALRGNPSVFEVMEERDILLHYPYQSFQHIIDLLREAAIDKDVTSIRMTLYRVANDSQIVNALINAIRNGKTVTVFVEIQARFDEEANIQWTERLAQEGAHVIHGIPGIKIHTKLILITRKKKGKSVRYACVGTGNFNESTAKIYTDHALLTVEPKIVGEVRNIFRFLKDNYKTFSYKHLLVSPFNMEKKLHRLINSEAKNAREGKEAYVYAKLNGLSQKKTIDRLYKAGNAGVDIKMVIRGVCCLLPGVEGLSRNIEVLSIVDKYLEHSRIYVFCNDGDPLVYISSADWMPRNLERRVEVAAPILDQALKQELVDYLNIQFEDNAKARVINEEQDNAERNSTGNKSVRAQVEIYEYLQGKAGNG